ncbi:aspartate kinase [Bacteroidales bacterium 6E]|nr:aspartate kinase [Bacteroidales bacterium 6E]
MKVLKFGGTSVGSAVNIKKVQEIVSGQSTDVVVVVSALGGITDKIVNAAKMAALGSDFYQDELEAIRERHFDVVTELFERPSGVMEEIGPLLQELEQVMMGVTLVNELTPKTMDRLLGMGERLSSLIISRYFGCELKDASGFILTDSQFGKATVDFAKTNAQIKSCFEQFHGVAIVPGFVAKNKAGEYTTLGRGGSDYTAAIIAAALDVDSLEIWTDVDGFMTADPKVIRKAYTIPVLSYTEAMELSNFGAKVIYPPTILPVYKKGIPVHIKNTLRPEADGTLITQSVANGRERPIKGISSISRIALLTVQGIGMVGVAGISMRLFTALAKEKINVILISQASSENTISIAIEEHSAEVAEEAIRKEFAHEIASDQINKVVVENNLSIVAIVGENMKHSTGIAGKLFTTIGRNGINVSAIAQGASEYNISWVVRNEDLRKTLNVVHESFFLSENVELNIFLIGVGLVGSHLLAQIARQHERLLNENHLNLKITGIANSRKMVFDRDGIDVANFKNLLSESEKMSKVSEFISEMISMNMYNSVFVDCTASGEIARQYHRILDANVSVVTANKIAASSEYENYALLKKTAKQKGVKFLFETNVGAGLPIINTLNDLVNSGDKVLRIEAVLSGTLNFIFNTLSDKIPFSKAVRMAKDAGYSEPDPRIDLSGVDVVRKLLILARESGYRIDKDDVRINSFIPEHYFEGSTDDFWAKLPELDQSFESRRKELSGKGMKWRFVASFEEGHAEVGLLEIGQQHPFYDLEGSNNLIIYRTERYNEFPMLIKGYGAGADVTAAGVFADIIKVSNI